MDIDDTDTWITGGYANDSDDFSRKTSRAEYSEYNSRFHDAPVPVKSQADMMLTEVEEQLEANETKYYKLRKKLSYMKGLYQNIEIIDSAETNDGATSKINSPREIVQNSTFVGHDNTENRLASGDARYHDFYTDMHNAQHRSRNEPENVNLSARSHRLSPRQNIFSNVQDENSSDSSAENSVFEEARSGDKDFDDAEPPENTVADNNLQIHRENEISDISSTRQHPYQLHLAEYSKDLQEEWEEVAEPSPPGDRELDPRSDPDSAKNRDVKRRELFIDISGSLGSVLTTNNKKSRSEKNRKVSGSVTSTSKKIAAKQVYETIGATTKIKRKRRRLKASNSRSTTATKDAGVSETKRDTKKKKQKCHATIPASKSSHHRHEISTNVQKSLSEMVEIYHNSAVKSGSISVVSSKHSRLEPRSRNTVGVKNCDKKSATKGGRKLVESHDRAKNNRDETDEHRSAKKRKNSQRIDGEGNRDRAKIYDQASADITELRSGEPNGAKSFFHAECTKAQSDDKMLSEYNPYQSHHHNSQSPNNLSSYDDPMAIRNYELPTVASTMKRVNRSYFNRFNFRNIPFVVGTSVTPSYNLGLNIQETLSLIKTRQMMPGGATPFLISRVSKGMRPVSTLLGCIRDRDEMPPEETSIGFDVNSGAFCTMYPEQMATGDSKIATNSVQLGPFALRTPRLSCAPDTQTLYEARQTFGNAKNEDSSAKKRNSQSICSSMKFNQQKKLEGRPELTQSVLLRQRQEELNIGDSQSTKWPSVAPGARGIREVLVNFHDQFAAMQLKYEKLQDQTEKSSDKGLLKEMESLEKELTAKEEEINAVVSLYKEVMALKQQMKMLHERNSLVCVATECPVNPMQTEISRRAYTANPVRMINICGRNGSSNNRGPSTSTRLAGLLRQIKTFQKQLKSS